MEIVYIQDQEILKYKGRFYYSKSSTFFSKYLFGLGKDDRLTVLCGIVETTNEEKIKRSLDVTDGRIQFIGLPNFRNVFHFHKALSLLKKHIALSDGCYIRTGVFAYFASRLCRKYKKRYMSIVNEDIYMNAKSSKKTSVRFFSRLLFILNKKAIKNADYALYVTKDYLQSKYPCHGSVLGCSDVETTNPNGDYESLRANKIGQFNKRSFIIGTAGSLTAFLKGQDICIKAISELKKKGIFVKYELAGVGDPSRLLRIARKYDVEEQVVVLGQLSHESMADWFNNLDIYVHPSRSEGLPRTIIEALFSSVPCLASNVGGIPELIQRDCLFDSKKQNSFKVLASLLENIDKKKLLTMSETNKRKSLDYRKNVLLERRNSFLLEFVNDIRIHN